MKSLWQAFALGIQGLLASLLLTGGAVAAESAAPAPANASASPSEPGVWQKHKYTFNFMGFTTTYSCDGLADKLKLLLIAAGARPDAKAYSGPCAAPFGRPDKFASADLVFYTLVPNDGSPVPAAAAPATKSKEPPEPVTYGQGSWRPVVFTSHSPRELGVGDCELIEQFQNFLLPMFATRAVINHTSCIPHQDSGSHIDLSFQAFAPTPAAPGAPRSGSG
jgi:hypothetical protein